MTSQPDNLPIHDAAGKLIGWRPNYAKAGTAEQVARQAFDNECAAQPVRSRLAGEMRAAQVARFESEMAAKYPHVDL